MALHEGMVCRVLEWAGFLLKGAEGFLIAGCANYQAVKTQAAEALELKVLNSE